MSDRKESTQKPDSKDTGNNSDSLKDILNNLPEEKGGPQGPEPTRYGDWESGGKCVDF